LKTPEDLIKVLSDYSNDKELMNDKSIEMIVHQNTVSNQTSLIKDAGLEFSGSRIRRYLEEQATILEQIVEK